MHTYAIDKQTITVILNGKAKCVPLSAPTAGALIAELTSPTPDENKIAELSDLRASLTQYSGDDCTISVDGTVTRHGVKLPAGVAEDVVDCWKSGTPYSHLLNYFDNLLNNPSKRAVEELYTFRKHKGMPITEDGCFFAYKGVRDDFWSITAGSVSSVIEGQVDDSGHIFNGIGEKIRVQRSYVDDDARQACSTGIHAGSEEYAKMWGSEGKVVIVKINPKDVVSVPYDSDCQKLRCCAYEVVAEYEGRMNDGGVKGNSAYDTFAASVREAVDALMNKEGGDEITVTIKRTK